MSDERLRIAERRWRSTGDEADERAFLEVLAREPREQLLLRLWGGSHATGIEAELFGRRWVECIARVDPRELVRMCIVATRFLLPLRRVVAEDSPAVAVADVEKYLLNGPLPQALEAHYTELGGDEPVHGAARSTIFTALRQAPGDFGGLVTAANDCMNAVRSFEGESSRVFESLEEHGPMVGLVAAVACARLLPSAATVSDRTLRKTIRLAERRILLGEVLPLAEQQAFLAALGEPKGDDVALHTARHLAFMLRPVETNEANHAGWMALKARDIAKVAAATTSMADVLVATWKALVIAARMRNQLTPKLDHDFVWPKRLSSIAAVFDFVLDFQGPELDFTIDPGT